MRISLIFNPTFSATAYHRQLFLSILLLMAAPLACVADGDPASAVKAVSKASHEFKFSSKVDSRGFIDIWQLKRDVAEVEALEASDETDVCHIRDESEEEDPSLSPKKVRSIALEHEHIKKDELNCILRIEEAHKTYRVALEAFNQAWLPALVHAMNKADPVAEVLLRQCSTTSIINRNEIESTCDPLPLRRQMALSRLKQIGFIPAIPLDPLPKENKLSSGRLKLQEWVLNAIVHGNLSDPPYEATRYWEDRDPKLNRKLIDNALLIIGFRATIKQAFSISENLFSDGGVLVLNKKPFRSNVLSWGNRTITTITDAKKWDGILFGAESHHCQRITYEGCASFENRKISIRDDLQSLLETTHKNIAKYLAQDSRWGAFLMKRVGPHEWLPHEAQQAPTKLDPLWMGRWFLDKHYVGFESEPIPQNGSADISFDGEHTLITIKTGLNPNRKTQHEGLRDMSDCILHDGGGLTTPSRNQSGSDTTLGNLESLDEFGSAFFEYTKNRWKNSHGSINGFEPFQNNQQYKQILLRCSEGEGLDEKDRTGRVRFLLLAGDTLVEIAVNAWWDGSWLHIRHFKRVAPAVIPYVNVDSIRWAEEDKQRELEEQKQFHIAGWRVISIVVGFTVGVSLFIFGVIFAYRKLTS